MIWLRRGSIIGSKKIETTAVSVENNVSGDSDPEEELGREKEANSSLVGENGDEMARIELTHTVQNVNMLHFVNKLKESESTRTEMQNQVFATSYKLDPASDHPNPRNSDPDK